MLERRGFFALFVAAALTSACGGQEPQPKVGPMEVTSVRDHLVFLDHGRNAALLVDVSGSAPPASFDVVPLVSNSTHFARRTDHDDELLVLSAGQPDDGVLAPEQPGLTVLRGDGRKVEYRYDSAFDQIAQSDDGKYAILSFSPGAASRSASLVFNPNEIAILDLETEGDPVIRTLRSVGGSVRSVVFSPELAIGNTAPRRVAVLLFDSVISILDLSNPGRPEFTVELSRRGAASLTLSQVLFSETEPKLYLRAQGSNDVYVISLTEADPGSSLENDFLPVLNQLGAGGDPSDLALFDEGGQPRLLVASPGSRAAVVIEPNGSNVTQIPLPRAANRILRFEGPSPFEDRTAPRALLYGQDETSVTFLDLEDIEERASRNVDLLTVAEPFSEAVRVDDETVMLVHKSTGLSLLDLGGRTVAKLAGPNLAGAVADPNVRKLWLPPRGQTRLGFLDLEQGFHPSEVRVDAPIESLVTVPASTRPKVVVTHASSVGWVTVLDAHRPNDASAAFSLRGFYLSGAR